MFVLSLFELLKKRPHNDSILSFYYMRYRSVSECQVFFISFVNAKLDMITGFHLQNILSDIAALPVYVKDILYYSKIIFSCFAFHVHMCSFVVLRLGFSCTHALLVSKGYNVVRMNLSSTSNCALEKVIELSVG